MTVSNLQYGQDLRLDARVHQLRDVDRLLLLQRPPASRLERQGGEVETRREGIKLADGKHSRSGLPDGGPGTGGTMVVTKLLLVVEIAVLLLSTKKGTR